MFVFVFVFVFVFMFVRGADIGIRSTTICYPSVNLSTVLISTIAVVTLLPAQVQDLHTHVLSSSIIVATVYLVASWNCANNETFGGTDNVVTL